MIDKTGLVYHFSDLELRKIALFFRTHDSLLPEEIESFRNKVENYIYNSMTIDEAENFFNENT
ncbi:MAG TPA: hypothetical protein VFC68_06850 [Treponemataceae bacterium]|nr:hypothetical protein [Treponemataceae bacterium]